MAQAEVGSARIRLAMDAGEFRKGTKTAISQLDRLAVKFGFTAGVAAHFGNKLGQAISKGLDSVVGAVGRTLTEFDKLTKLSRSIGVPVEEMSKLQHAAELSGASVEELGRAFRNVARNMQGAARGPTDFSRALDSLNVSWRDASGNFLQADQLMLKVADKFKGMEDGAGKTALAMKIFGEEMGPRLVSMLNSGADGIKGMTSEAERLGLAFDSTSGEAAERFNDQMDRIGKVTDGLSNRLTVKMLPTLEMLANRFAEWATKGDGVKTMADNISFAFTGLVSAALQASQKIDQVWLNFKAFAQNTRDFFKLSWSEIETRNNATAAVIAKRQRDLAVELEQLWANFNSAGSGWQAMITGGGGEGGQGAKPPVVAALEQQNAALQLVNEAERERLRIMEAMRDPYDVMIDQQTRLNELFGASAAHAGILAKANQMAAMAMQNAYARAASSVSGALSGLFEKSKGLAIANALINTYEAVTAALKNPPGPPFSYAYAAAALANGMAQVQAIRSTNKSGSGGGGGGSSGAGSAASAPTQTPQSVSINLEGERFGRDQVRGLIENINDAVADGAVLRVT